MKSQFLARGYPKDLIEDEMKKFKLTKKNRDTKTGKLMKAFPFPITYHLNFKSMNKVILKYLDLLYMGKDVK